MAEQRGATQEVRNADHPFTILRHEGWQVLKDTWAESSNDNVSLIAAGTAFWGFAAIAPILAATVLTYGIFATPEVVTANIRSLFGVLPRDAAALIADQLSGVVKTSSGKKGGGLLLAIGLALYGGSQGASALIAALNIAYEERETRGFVTLYLLGFAITAAAVALAIGAGILTTIVAFIDGLIPGAPPFLTTIVRFASYFILACFAVTAAAMLYRFAPDRAHAKWVWLTPGSLLAAVLWLVANSIFALYVSRFGNYGATYGSLSAVIVLLFWLWLSAYAFLFGGELNSQLERRTAKDTTVGPDRPLGERGAAVADHAGEKILPPQAREAVEAEKS